VLRGSNFALRKNAARAHVRAVTGVLFGIGSVLTPYCLGAALGGVAAGRVPPGEYAGDPWTSWWNPTAVAAGLLSVAVGAYLAATYLVVEAQRRDRPELVGYFRRRALTSGLAGLVLGGVALVALYADHRPMFDRLLTRGSVPLLLGAAGLAAALLLAVRHRDRPGSGTRVAAALGVAGLVWGWGIAQYPYLLPFGLSITEGAGAAVNQRWVLAWAAVAVVAVGPALLLLYALEQRGVLGDEPAGEPQK
jgi:cytochrome d ubiquinol oxidase subunit II